MLLMLDEREPGLGRRKGFNEKDKSVTEFKEKKDTGPISVTLENTGK